MPGVDQNKVVGRGGGPRGIGRGPGLRRLLGLREGLGAWAFPIGRIGPVRLYFHAIALVWLGGEIAAWSRATWLRQGEFAWWGHLSICIAMILVMALLHEMGRIVWRRIGAGRTASAEPSIVLWPLGGLTPAEPVLCARPVLAEAGGMLTTILAGSGCLAWAIGVGVPLDLTAAGPMWPVDVAARLTSPVQVAAFWSLHAAVVVTAANLLPAPAFDGGRMLEVWLSKRRGWLEAGVLAARIGLFVGIAVITIGAVMGWTRFMAIGVVAAMGSVVWQRRIETLEWFAARDNAAGPTPERAAAEPLAAGTSLRAEPASAPDDPARPSNIHSAGREGPGRGRRADVPPGGGRTSPHRGPDESRSDQTRPAQKGESAGAESGSRSDTSEPSPEPSLQAEDAQLDAVLEKLSREGKSGLNDADREILRRATERRRRG